MAALRKTLVRRFSQIAKAATATAAAPAGRLLPREEPGPIRRFLSSFLQKRSIFQPALPAGDRLLDRIRGLNPDRVLLDLILPTPAKEEDEEEKAVPVAELRKLARASRMGAARARLRATGKICISRAEFLGICGEAEVARSLDESGAVVVWGDVVFLRPEEIAYAIEKAIPRSLSPWSDAHREELMKMEETKAEIDRRAAAQVRRELWCGLGLLVVQTAAFMRLTFWELSWDVMEPICFYVTSIYFMAGYTFFLRTSKEPSFEGFFETRFAARQRRLMKAANFDVRRFDELRRACPSAPQQQLTPTLSNCHCVGRAH